MSRLNRILSVLTALGLLLTPLRGLRAEAFLPSVGTFFETARGVEVPTAPAGREDLSDFSWDTLAGYTRRHARPLDWTELMSGPEPVVYLGEAHFVAAIKKELAAHMAEIRAAGITHIALEMFGTDRQEALDRFHSDGSGREELLEVIQNDWGWVPEDYVAMLEAMAAAGVKPVAIDLSRDEKLAVFKRCKELGGGGCASPMYEARDHRMVDSIRRLLEEQPGARVLAFVGNDHVDVSEQPARLEAACGVATRRYLILWGADFFDAAVDEAGLSWKRVFLPLPRDEARTLDGVLALPEVRKEGNGTGMLPGSPDD